MSAASHVLPNPNANDFVNKIRFFKEIFASGRVVASVFKNSFRIGKTLARIENKSRVAMTELRSAFAECQGQCDERNKCFSSALNLAKESREVLMELEDILESRSMWTPLTPKFRDLRVDWDDLVEDLTLSCDQEFKDLVGEIEKAL